ncbi:MAG: hypothetical protein FJZ00_02985 [Candidatus Sericytochromatia bacterium]|uniref:Uncharacterized protein n=1 Tax=Candidatus Tanganyikabacteria bacterium TaxID=2961651 RepID=A0A937X4G0_9BACT|nr:hypothetical protein [Candidatus Tanganyikabacteria bacterium]
MATDTVREATLTIRPAVESGKLHTQAIIQPYISTDINHLQIKVFKVVGGGEQVVLDSGGSQVMIDLPAASLSHQVAFSKLGFDTTYRIRAYAYADAGTAQLISTSDSRSYVDVVIARDDRPVVATLPVKLLDKAFDAQATASAITMTAGGIAVSGPAAASASTSDVKVAVAGATISVASGRFSVDAFNQQGVTFANADNAGLDCLFTGSGTWNWGDFTVSDFGPGGTSGTSAGNVLASEANGALIVKRGSGAYELLGAGPTPKTVAAGETLRLMQNPAWRIDHDRSLRIFGTIKRNLLDAVGPPLSRALHGRSRHRRHTQVRSRHRHAHDHRDIRGRRAGLLNGLRQQQQRLCAAIQHGQAPEDQRERHDRDQSFQPAHRRFRRRDGRWYHLLLACQRHLVQVSRGTPAESDRRGHRAL